MHAHSHVAPKLLVVDLSDAESAVPFAGVDLEVGHEVVQFFLQGVDVEALRHWCLLSIIARSECQRCSRYIL